MSNKIQRMKKNTINDLFRHMQDDFDIDMPNTGHEHRFLDKLKSQQNPVIVSKFNAFNYWRPFLAVAATIILCFSVFTVIQQQEPELRDLANVSPELSQTQSFFVGAIEQEIAAIEAQRSPETNDMIEGALKSLKVLETEYQTLKVDLTESGNDKRVIYAMINNFQNRIDILKTVLEHIEEVKTFKQHQNENTI